MKRRVNFFKSMVFAAMMLLGVGYAVVSSKVFTSDATIHLGERLVQVQINKGTLSGEAGVLTEGTISDDGLTISFESFVTSYEVENVKDITINAEFESKETDINVAVTVSTFSVEIDGVEYTNVTVNDGFFSGSSILEPGAKKTYEFSISLGDDIVLDLYSEMSISLTFVANYQAD